MRRLAFPLLILLLTSCASSTAEQPIGFRVVDLYDKVRTFVPNDYVLGRPLRVRLWYPALDGGRTLSFGDYVVDRPMSGVPDEVWRAVLANDRGGISRPERRAAASLNASPARERFPLVVYVPRAGEPLEQSAALAESLASDGFVVAVIPRLGRTPADGFGPDPEVLAQDIRFIARQLRGLADVDERRIAVITAAADAPAARVARDTDPAIGLLVESGGSIRRIARSLSRF